MIRELLIVSLAACGRIGFDGGASIDGSTPATGIELALGGTHTCVLDRATGDVRCWGYNANGQLGYGTVTPIGLAETAAAAPRVPLPRPAISITAGYDYTCAAMDDGDVWCWGSGARGHLGNGLAMDLGDDEPIGPANRVTLLGPAMVVRSGQGGGHTCALLADRRVECWGSAVSGQLGYGSLADVGDDETVASVGPVQVGFTAAAIAVGSRISCAISDDDRVRCWGSGSNGLLGTASTFDVGDTEPPTFGETLSFGSPTTIAGGGDHACAMYDGNIVCWGSNGGIGALGNGGGASIGDDERADQAAPLPLPRATSIVAGYYHTCAAFEDGRASCWGANNFGQLGLASTTTTPTAGAMVDVGAKVIALVAGFYHTCAILSGDRLRCWGNNAQGQLGYGIAGDIGDNEPPAVVGDVPYRP